MQSWGVVHRTPNPTYARVNEQAERMVQVAKNLIKKSSAEETLYHLGLQEIRNTPITNGMPAQLLQGRTLRSKIPGPEKALFPHTYDQARVKVYLQGKWRRAVVSKHLPEPRSYHVETDDGTRYRRQRMHINRNYGLSMARRELFRTIRALPVARPRQLEISRELHRDHLR